MAVSGVMTIKDDWAELIAGWKKLSPIGKLIGVVLFAMSVLSIASLADSVFALRGFIESAIDFYRALTSPIAAFLSKLLRFRIEQELFDLVAAAILINTATEKAAFTELSQSEVAVPRLLYFLHHAISLITWIIVAMVLFLINPTGGLILATVSLPMWWLVRGYVMNKIFKREQTFEERVDRRTSVYILTVYTVVAILAAISEGLARPFAT